MRQRVHDDPNYELPTDIKQLRQSTYKHEHVQRKQQGNAAAVLSDLRKSRPKAGEVSLVSSTLPATAAGMLLEALGGVSQSMAGQ